MGSLLHPVGPQPPATYWLRRALALAVALLLVVVVAQVFGGSDETAAAHGPAATPTSTATGETAAPGVASQTPGDPQPEDGSGAVANPSAALHAAADGPVRCPSSAIRVSATTDRRLYTRGQRPRLRLAVENVGPTACKRDIGQQALSLTITSGSDRIWSSDDCAPGGSPKVRKLAPGTPYVVALSWSRRRSVRGCSGGAQQARPGFYALTGAAGDVHAAASAFQLR